MDFETFKAEADKYADWIRTGQPPPPDPADIFRPGYQSETLDHTAVTPTEAFRLALKHRIMRCVIGTESRKVDLGRTQRLYAGASRLAVLLRDKTCRQPGCDQPGTQIDHIQEWQHGGGTDTWNGKLLCTGHHTQKTEAEKYRWRYQPPEYADPF